MKEDFDKLFRDTMLLICFAFIVGFLIGGIFIFLIYSQPQYPLNGYIPGTNIVHSDIGKNRDR